MYARIGDIVFEPLSSFNSYSDDDGAVIAQYQLLTGKPVPQFTALELRTVTVSMRLHQRFIKVKDARNDLKGYKDSGTVVPLVWGNGDVDGKFLISNINTTIEEQDVLGNVFSVIINLTLLEYPDANTQPPQYQYSYKKALATRLNAVPVINHKQNKITKKLRAHLLMRITNNGIRIIGGLSIGNILDSRGSVLNLHLNSIVSSLTELKGISALVGIDTNFSTSFDAAVGNALNASISLRGLIPVTNLSAYLSGFDILNNAVINVNRTGFLLTAQIVCRKNNLIFN